MSNRELNETVKVHGRSSDPLSLESLIAWLETKDPEEEYNWADYERCLIVQYCEATGADYVAVACIASGKGRTAPIESLAYDRPHTFGAALSRVRALSKEKA